jgi:hypothetical protein
MDTDYENISVKETLSRHRTILESFCKAKKLVLKKVTVYRSQDDKLSIQLYPNLPK